MLKINTFFDFFKAIFENTREIDSMDKSQFTEYAFILNRYMSFAYPKQGMLFNHFNMNPEVTIQFWINLGYRYNSQPKWAYVKRKKEKKFENVESFFEHFELDSYAKRKLMILDDVLEEDLSVYNKMYKIEKC